MKNPSELLYEIAFKHKNAAKWVFVVIVILTSLFCYNRRIFDRIELFTVDYRFKLRHVATKPSDIVFIDMSEDSVAAIGGWPWPRKWHATLVTALSEFHPKAIAFDVIFSEPQDENDDLALEAALKASGKVYLPVVYYLDEQRSKDRSEGQGVTGILKSMEIFRRWVRGTGHINGPPDRDGILRRIPLVVNFKGNTTYHFGFKIGCDMLGIPENNMVFYPNKHEVILQKPDGRSIIVPLDSDNQLIINWRGAWAKSFTHYSYIDVLHSYALMKKGEKPAIDLNVFKDKICIVGLTASGLIDIKPTPLDMAYPAVGVNATAAYSVMNNDFIRVTSAKIDSIIIVIIGMIMTLLLFGRRPVDAIVLAVAGMTSYTFLSFIVFGAFGILVTTLYPVFATLLSYGITAFYTQIINAMEKTNLFKQAITDGLTQLYNIRHFNLLLEKELKNISMLKGKNLSLVMFDVDNFKQINDTYGHQAGDMILKEFAGAMRSKCRHTDILARYGGEEFIIMLVGAGEKEASDVAEKIRTTVENKKFTFKTKLVNVTLSGGIAQYSNEKSKDELISKADKALYRAKQEGKNRICLGSICT